MYSQGMFSIGGIASGMDTDSIVSQLMQLERQPVVRMQNTQTQLKQVDSAWGQVNTKLSALRTAVDAIAKPDAFDKLVAVTSSNADAVGVSASGTSGSGSVSFKVTQLAQSHQLTSGTFAAADTALAAGTVDVTVDGKTTSITLDGSQTLTDLADDLNAAKGGFSASVIKVAEGDHRLLLTGQKAGSTQGITLGTTNIAGLRDTDATILRGAQDATVELGSGASTMTVTRSSNTFSDLLPGASITLKQTTTEPITVSASRDVDGAVKAVKSYVDALNGAIGTLADLSGYDAAAEKGGVLQGDSTARSLLSKLRSAVTAPTALTSGFSSGYQVGLGVDRTGKVTLDETKLKDALTENFEGVTRLFSTTGSATSSSASVTGTNKATPGTYEVQISRAATVASITGTAYTPPGTTEPKTFRVTSGGTTVSITIDSTQTTAEQAAVLIQQKLDEAGVADLSASATAGGELKLETARYGSAASFTVEGLNADGTVNAADTVFGLSGTHEGLDVQGYLHEVDGTPGDLITGTGQLLSGTGSAEGILVTHRGDATETFQVTYSHGLAGGMSETLKLAEGSGGMVQRARDGITRQIDMYQDRIDGFDIRLQTRETTLRRQFTAMEVALSQLQSQGNWLAGQLGGLSANAPQG